MHMAAESCSHSDAAEEHSPKVTQSPEPPPGGRWEVWVRRVSEGGVISGRS